MNGRRRYAVDAGCAAVVHLSQSSILTSAEITRVYPSFRYVRHSYVWNPCRLVNSILGVSDAKPNDHIVCELFLLCRDTLFFIKL